MWYHGCDACCEQALDYELRCTGRSGEALDDSAARRRAAAERPIPLQWAAAWLGGLNVISLGLGLASRWLLQ